jgi:hypothetical protein
MQNATKLKPKMWETSTVGFANFAYKYANSSEGNWYLIGFSPRKQNLTVYNYDKL